MALLLSKVASPVTLIQHPPLGVIKLQGMLQALQIIPFRIAFYPQHFLFHQPYHKVLLFVLAR